MNKYTSLKLSKLLVDNGFEGDSEYKHIRPSENKLSGEKFPNSVWYLTDIEDGENDAFKYESYYAYDILNDLCVKYAKEMFGGDFKMMKNKTDWILYNLQKNMKDIAEEYLWEHCLFNHINKEKMKCPVCNIGIHRVGYIMEYNDEGILVESVCRRCKGKGFILVKNKL